MAKELFIGIFCHYDFLPCQTTYLLYLLLQSWLLVTAYEVTMCGMFILKVLV